MHEIVNGTYIGAVINELVHPIWAINISTTIISFFIAMFIIIGHSKIQRHYKLRRVLYIMKSIRNQIDNIRNTPTANNAEIDEIIYRMEKLEPVIAEITSEKDNAQFNDRVAYMKQLNANKVPKIHLLDHLDEWLVFFIRTHKLPFYFMRTTSK